MRRPGVVKVRRIRIARLGAEDIERWHELVARAVEVNPCYEPEFLRPAAAAVGPADLELVIAVERGRWVALFPVRRVWRVGRLPLPFLATWAGELSFLDTPLVDAGAMERAVSAILDELVRPSAPLGLVIERIPSGPVADVIREVAPANRRPVTLAEYDRAATFRSPGGAADTIRHVNVPRKRRRLERDFGSVDVTETWGDLDAVERYLEVESAGWKGRAGTAMANSPAELEFFRRMCRGFASDGRLQTLTLHAGTEVAAVKVNIVSGGVVFHLKIAYDERFGRYSPGRILEHEALERFAGDDCFTMMDSCASASGTVLDDIWTGRRRMQTLVVPTGPVARAVVARAAASLAGRRQRRARVLEPARPARDTKRDGTE